MKNFTDSFTKTVLFRGTTNREYVIEIPGERDLLFTTKFSEATVFRDWEADRKMINWPSHQLQKIPLND